MPSRKSPAHIDPTDLQALVTHHRLRFTKPVRQPLVLISQVQRSGGTLLCQLLDGHSELHVHPGELHVGPTKYDWPALDPQRSPDELFDELFEPLVLEYAASGYQKLSRAEKLVDKKYRRRTLPFIFSAGLQRALFAALGTAPAGGQREVLDRYATSYFNAWLDYQGLYRPESQVKYWVAFAARLLARPGNAARFVADYPDGRAIAVVRDPVSWFASARRHAREYEHPGPAIALWLETFGIILQNAERYPEQTLILRFEECLDETEAVMRRVAAFLGIRFEPSLLTPTFNGMAIESDSSFGAKLGVDRSAADRRDFVDAATQRLIEADASELHRRLCQVADAHSERFRA